MTKPKSKLSQGPIDWALHPGCVDELVRLRSIDAIAWAVLRKRMQKSRRQSLKKNEHRFPMQSADVPIGHLPIDETSDPDSYVRFYFGEHDSVPPVLGLSVAVKPASYAQLGEEKTRNLQNQHIGDAVERYGSHPEVLRYTATGLP